MLKGRGVSERQACRLGGIGRSSLRYEPHPRDDEKLAERLKKMARKRKRYGYRRVWALLRREGETVNHKRVWRVWKKEGLQVPHRRRRKRRRPGGEVPSKALRPDHVWAYDFIQDACEDGRKLKMLTVLDEFTRECISIEVGRSIRARDVLRVLDGLFAQRGRPRFLRSDNGPEFIAQALTDWLADSRAETIHIEPGKPWQNGFEESFHSGLRDECLNMESFWSAQHAQVVVECWRVHYNQERPHSSLGYLTPVEFRRAWHEQQAGALPPAPRSLTPSGAPEGQRCTRGKAPRVGTRERQDGQSCPSVRSPAAALGSLSSGALPSGRAVANLP
jgi:putative transposase